MKESEEGKRQREILQRILSDEGRKERSETLNRVKDNVLKQVAEQRQQNQVQQALADSEAEWQEWLDHYIHSQGESYLR